MAVPFHFEEVDEIDVIRQQLQAILSLLANRPRTMHQQTSTAQSSNHHQGRFLNTQPGASTTHHENSSDTNNHNHNHTDHENSNTNTSESAINATSTDQINNSINISINNTVDGTSNIRSWRSFREEITNLAQQLTDEQNATRTQEDSSNNDQTKISITTFFGNTHDWAHLGVTMRRIAEATPTTAIKTEQSTTQSAQNRANGLLSELIPDDWTTPLWTAMICFVGWHVFRSR